MHSISFPVPFMSTAVVHNNLDLGIFFFLFPPFAHFVKWQKGKTGILLNVDIIR